MESITQELQQKKAERLARGGRATTTTTNGAPSELSSGPPSVAEEDEKSLRSFQSEGYVRAGQSADGDAVSGESSLSAPPKAKKTKAQLWAELKISCTFSCGFFLLSRKARFVCGGGVLSLLT